MDDDRKQRIAALAAKAHDAHRYYEALGMMNTSGKKPEELREQSVAYALAGKYVLDLAVECSHFACLETDANAGGANAPA